MSTKPIIELYVGFTSYLNNERSFIAPLQLTGRLEDYLVKEFIGYTYDKTKGNLLGLTNLGKKRDRSKFDIAFITTSSGSEEIMGLIEAKYLRNVHRYYTDNSAQDEIATTLKGLLKQINVELSPKHSDYQVNLQPRDAGIFGLVFASYVEEKKPNRKEEFYNRIRNRAEKLGFLNYDLTTPKLDVAYENFDINSIDKTFSVTLMTGLWQISKQIQHLTV